MSGPLKGDKEPLRRWVSSGLVCELHRAPLYGAVNGYVKVKLSADQEYQVNVHGGVTWHTDEWVGFDTLHSGDWWPGEGRPRRTNDREWTEDDVAAETERLAAECKRVVEQ